MVDSRAARPEGLGLRGARRVQGKRVEHRVGIGEITRPDEIAGAVTVEIVAKGMDGTKVVEAISSGCLICYDATGQVQSAGCVIPDTTAPATSVATDSTIRQGRGATVEDAAALGSAVAADSTVRQRYRHVGLVQHTAAYGSNVVTDRASVDGEGAKAIVKYTTAATGCSVAADRAVRQRQPAIVKDAATEVGTVTADLAVYDGERRAWVVPDATTQVGTVAADRAVGQSQRAAAVEDAAPDVGGVA